MIAEGRLERTVTVFDQLTLRSDAMETWLGRLRAEYLPAASERGMRLVGIWKGHTRHPDLSAVVVQWEYPSVGAYWIDVRQTMGDPAAVHAFWAATDAIALTRDRRVLEALEEL